VGEHRPGEVVLRVGKESALRIGGIGTWHAIDREYAGPGVSHVAGRDVAIGRDQIAAEHPEQLLVGRTFEPQFLADRLDVEKLALVPVLAEQEEDQGFLDWQEVEGIARQYLLDGVVRGDRGDAEVLALVGYL